MKYLYLFLVLVIIKNCQIFDFTGTEMPGKEERILDSLVSVALKYSDQISFGSDYIPRALDEKGNLVTTNPRKWTSGFYAGTLWLLYEYSQNEEIRDVAKKWTELVENEKLDSSTHDLGFKVFNSFGNGWKLTSDTDYEKVISMAAETLSSRYNPTVGAIRSWDHHAHVWDFPVIIDNMMNLELLFEASKITGDQKYSTIAIDHANTTMKSHFREDQSSYHVIDFSPETGEIQNKNTHQGAFDESAWSRGQAWGLYGFTVMYRYTRDQKYLDQANKIADFVLSHPHLPKDGIPYWDFNASEIPNTYRDVSAATIMASAFYELAKYNTQSEKKYLDHAEKILKSLDNQIYKSETAPFFLDHSVGNLPGGSEIDVPIIYADYYYVEALLRKLKY